MPSQTEAEKVLLIHGLAGHRWLMRPMSKSLTQAGFSAKVWGYRSLTKDAKQHANALRRQLETIDAGCEGNSFHIVAHSLGAILTRIALHEYTPLNLNRIVMLGPPNHGSHVAGRLSPWVGWLCQTLVDIGDSPQSLVRRLPDNLGDRFELGIMLADNDFVVMPDSTQLPNVRDTTRCAGRHSGLLFSSEAFERIESFSALGALSFTREHDGRARFHGLFFCYGCDRSRTPTMTDSPRRLPACPKSPNCVSSQAEIDSQAMSPLQFNGTAAEALEQIVQVVQRMPRVQLLNRDDCYLHFVFTTRLLRFRDDVEFLIDETQQRVDFRSASRLGYSDLSANRKRMLEICQRLCQLQSFRLG